jgi:hypothetical protein
MFEVVLCVIVAIVVMTVPTVIMTTADIERTCHQAIKQFGSKAVLPGTYRL